MTCPTNPFSRFINIPKKKQKSAGAAFNERCAERKKVKAATQGNVVSEFIKKYEIKNTVSYIDIPIQETPITVDNFFIRSKGWFVELQEIPKDFNLFFSSKKSSYYTNTEQTELIRVSDHWGRNINFCAWYLIGYEPISAYKWRKEYGKGPRIGKICFSEFFVNNHFRRKQLHRKKREGVSYETVSK